MKHWADEEDSTGRRSVGAREVQAEGREEEDACGGVTGAAAGNYSKIVADLVAGQKALSEGLQQQQQALAVHMELQRQQVQQQQQTLTQLMAQLGKPAKTTGCFKCGKDGHYR